MSRKVIGDAECVAFLQWALPRLELRWTGFRNFRGQVCKRIRRRMAEVGIEDLAAYRALLERDDAEWSVLEAQCGVTISRFYRDRGVWDALRSEVLPSLAETTLQRGARALRCWSVGCASGEEPYTLSIAWQLDVGLRFPELELEIVATDFDPRVLERARVATYPAGTLKELPSTWRERSFEERGGQCQLKEAFRRPVQIRQEDVRRALPEGRFSLILARNVVFTYFDEALQERTLARMLGVLDEGGALVLGRHERLPPTSALEPWRESLCIFRRAQR